MTDHSKQHYYTAERTAGSWCFRVFHYDPTGNREVTVDRSAVVYSSKEKALDAAVEWLEATGLEDRVGEVKLSE